MNMRFIVHDGLASQRRVRYTHSMNTSQFITASEWEESSHDDPAGSSEYPDEVPYSDVALQCRELSGLATSGDGISRISVPRELKRARVVSAFQDAFELIGGVPRLAHWADSHQTDFYKLYARLLPVEASKRVTHDGGFVIRHILPRGPLDDDGVTGGDSGGDSS